METCHAVSELIGMTIGIRVQRVVLVVQATITELAPEDQFILTVMLVESSFLPILKRTYHDLPSFALNERRVVLGGAWGDPIPIR